MNRTHPVFHVSLLEPYQVNDIPGRLVPEPPPIIIDGQEEFEVTEISNSRFAKGKGFQYLVHWLGYQKPTWEHIANVSHCKDLIEEFHVRYPNKPKP